MPPADSEASRDGFDGLGLDPRLLSSLKALGYEEPTDIQREAIPPLLAGSDLLGQAATGTGKTAAFALPLLQHIVQEGGSGKVKALILVPTRELAIQVAEAVHRYGRELRTSVLPIYGGQSIGQQLRVLQRGVDVVVGTPGRILDHLNRQTLNLEGLRILVLDEADEMLDMGFAEDLEAILAATPAGRQTALFSATMPPRITHIASRHLKNPVRITIAREVLAAGEMPRVRQVAYFMPRAYKQATLGRVLDVENPDSAIVFCRTRTEVDELTEALNGHGYRAEALHGGMSQEQRDRVMGRFRTGTADLLIATDVAARGLDIEHISHVVNYDVPSSPEAYVHRIGRTGRAGRAGVAITLAEPREHRLLRNIEQLTRRKIEIATVPTVADLRSRQLELLRASLRELLIEGDLDRYRAAVESLGAEFDVMDVAAAAIKLAQQASGTEREEEEIPSFVPGRRETRGGERPFRARDGGERPFRAREAEEGPVRAREAGEGPLRAPNRRGPPETSRRQAPAREGWDTARLYVNLGRQAGIRPRDLVEAIVRGAGVDVRSIGAIEIADRHSLVEVPEELADQLVEALNGTRIRSRNVIIRRFREP